MKTLVIVSHAYPEQSTAIKALQKVAGSLDKVQVRNLESLYGHDTGAIDVATEQAAAEAADRLVFLFPIHWFNVTPMLKAYLNQVWSHGWAFGPGGTALQGKEMQVVVTAGASALNYTQQGHIRSSMAEILSPMRASAHYVGMLYNPPLAFYDAMDMAAETLANWTAQLQECLEAPLGSHLQLG
ncbi:NAD(P)H-dependent oxidoreductase [Aeromonas bivalvium]|uniref:NAD(P)H-dependent oxidoreductase n=1 Tax=Aeromonas bivalvium TaxID=440079 RepID=UPI0038CFD1F6